MDDSRHSQMVELAKRSVLRTRAEYEPFSLFEIQQQRLAELCPECHEQRPDDDRVPEMKCGPCSYGAP